MENEKNTAQEILQEELAAIYIGNLNTVDEDLILPEQGKKGCRFTWESGEERFIEPNGKVHRPLHGMGSRKVILTVPVNIRAVRHSAALRRMYFSRRRRWTLPAYVR